MLKVGTFGGPVLCVDVEFVFGYDICERAATCSNDHQFLVPDTPLLPQLQSQVQL